MNILLAVYLRVVAVFLAIAIFNLITIKRSYDDAFGYVPLSWKGFKCLLKDLCRCSMKRFLLDWWVGMFHYETMVEARREVRREMRRARFNNAQGAKRG
jgi:hypothetical protein